MDNILKMFLREHLMNPSVTMQSRMTDLVVVQTVARVVELKGETDGDLFGVVPVAKVVAVVVVGRKKGRENRLKFV